jgi:hypothetical protein
VDDELPGTGAARRLWAVARAAPPPTTNERREI